MAPRQTTNRIDALERVTARMPTAAPAEQRGAIGDLLLDLLAAKLAASTALADGARQLMATPGWVAQQDADGLAALGAYLDSSALALGDRLAHRREEADDGS